MAAQVTFDLAAELAAVFDEPGANASGSILPAGSLNLDDFFGGADDSAPKSGAILPAGSLSLDAFFGGGEAEAVRAKARETKRAQRERAARGEVFEKQTDPERKEKRRASRDASRERARADKIRNIAVLDMETDPFDAQTRDRIAPFAACLYSDQFQPVIIWEEDEAAFVSKVIAAIEALPGAYTIYAHNGGKFDFLFLIHRLRGRVSFKGRGIMAAKIGSHELRDSFHLIPEALSSYKKDEFDYEKMRKGKRQTYREEITDYLLNDCIYLFDIVKAFLTNYGMKISIGQAAMHLLKKEYPECENIPEIEDTFLRQFFFGGRVECIGGRGDFRADLLAAGTYKLFDVNGMYPFVMSYYLHPIGRAYRPRKGMPNEFTCFIDLNCYSRGAFPVKRDGEGTVFPHEFGRFKVSIHEYRAALKLGLISRVTVNYCVDNEKLTDFARFILPLYNMRQLVKEQLKALEAAGKKGTEEYLSLKKDDIFLKLLMNNAYGKFCQNPRRFKEHFITDWNGEPDDERETWGAFPTEICSDYAIWSRPVQKLRFNNVGTGASITGAARAVLLEARHKAVEPIYCDTDSLICRDLSDVRIHKSELGAWDLEAEMSRVMIAGKKLYAYEKTDGERKIKAKGVRGVKWEGIKSLVDGGELVIGAFAPTLTKTGAQKYIDRRIRATTR